MAIFGQIVEDEEIDESCVQRNVGVMPAGAEHLVVQRVNMTGFNGFVNSPDEEEYEKCYFSRREEDEQSADVPSRP